ncbi:MAG: GldM family protein [Cyclobacteriaceae bacterium]|nr:GldM family protein [Cyclobacteriaceae bacterium]
MAGGKETPRQKMIGMMYMVLTALLALNVSSAVLEKFAIIDETLVELVKDTGESNNALLKAIEGSTVKSAEVDEVKDKAKKVRELTKTTLAYMDGVKKQMSTGKDGQPLKDVVQDTHHADELMLNDKNGPSLAKAYEKTLNKHVADLNAIMKSAKPFHNITKTAGQYASFKDAKEELKKQNYPIFAFHGTPTMGAIAYVSQMQTEILEYERTALSELLATTKGKVYEVDQLVPMVRAKSNSLVAGATYEGDLFVAGAASGVDPVMFKGGQPVKVEEVEVSKGIKIKMGKIKFVAGATGYDQDGIAKMSYPVTINIPGRDPIVQSIEYNVIKPNVKFESAASSTLYKECGNVKNVSIPGLPDMSAVNLTCSPEDGKIIPLGSGAYSLLPARANMKVRITMGGAEIGVENFSAIPVPEPQFILKYQNQDLNFEKGVPPNARVNVEIRLPDNFSSQNKKDAGYRITKMRISTRTGIKEMSSGNINLIDLGARSNDVLGIVSITVVRSTYDPKDDDNLPVNFKFTPIAIPVK